jgi:hypothetical protein
MPFSNDEPIIIEDKSKLKTVVLILSFGLYLISLFNVCFCTESDCRISFEVLLLGWLPMLTGGAAIAWLANPMLILAWLLLAKNKKVAWFFGLLASIICISFLKFKVIIENEAGHYTAIKTVGLGYWLWLSSCLTTFIGSLTIRAIKHTNHRATIISY